MISIPAVVHIIIVLIVAGLIFWLLNWAITYVGIPEPFNKVARVVLALLAVLIVVGALLSLISPSPIFRL